MMFRLRQRNYLVSTYMYTYVLGYVVAIPINVSAADHGDLLTLLQLNVPCTLMYIDKYCSALPCFRVLKFFFYFGVSLLLSFRLHSLASLQCK